MSMMPRLALRLGLPLSNTWYRSIKAFAPNVIHAHFLNDGQDALNLGQQLNVPVITTLHGHDITKAEKKKLFKRSHASFFALSDKLIAVSNYIADQALRKGCPDDKLVQHYIGIDVDRFSLGKQESATPALLFVGRLTEKKGVTYLLQALRRLKSRWPEIKLTIVGTGVLQKSLRREAQDYGLQVDFVGQKSPSEIRQLLSTHWLFTAPSITADNGDAEGLGMVFLEAQAMQTPVVSFHSGGVVEAVADGETGLLCAEKDIEALADNIEILLNDESLRRKMGIAGRARIERDFDIRKQCGKLEAIYDSVINAKA